jgi:hypothetical protein
MRMIPSRSHPCASSYTAVLRSGQLSAGDAVPLGNAAACSTVTTGPGPARPSTADGPRGRWRRWPLRAHRGALGPAPGSRRGSAGLHAPRRPPLHGGLPVQHRPVDLKTRRPSPFPLPATQRRQRHLRHPRHVLLGQQALVVAHRPVRHGPPPMLHCPADRLIAEPAAETRTLSLSTLIDPHPGSRLGGNLRAPPPPIRSAALWRGR